MAAKVEGAHFAKCAPSIAEQRREKGEGRREKGERRSNMKRNLIPWKRNKENVPMQRVEDNPFLALHQRMNGLFEDFFDDFEGAFRTPGLSPLNRTGFGGAPSLDVSETDDEVSVTADLPGLTEKDVEVTLDNDLLTIKGTRNEEREEKKRNYQVMERSYGEFQRVVPMPAGIDKDKAKATFKNGVLKLSLPKRPEAKTERRKISISTG
jgi:HSP20 family protein